jgi:hypothetical protein
MHFNQNIHATATFNSLLELKFTLFTSVTVYLVQVVKSVVFNSFWCIANGTDAVYWIIKDCKWVVQ